MNKFLCLSILALLTFKVALFGQGIVVTGTVTSLEDGSPLPGVNIMVQGTTNGITTNVDGKYTISVPNSDASLVFSFIGFLTETVKVGNQNQIDVSMSPDITGLQEVVVTALGVKREKKALGYSVQEVNGQALVENRENNVLNGLSGKVAGLQVSKSGTGDGGSSKVTIRGYSSIAGNNQPLIVIDGSPVDNFVGDANDRWGNRVLDRGSSMSDINPDDIESMSVLKGPTASALYGSRASNGVIMITTKKGKSQKGIGVTFNSNTVIAKSYPYLDMQNSYGQGSNGLYDPSGTSSWGPKMTGQTDVLYAKDTLVHPYADYTGVNKTYQARNNNLTDFLQTGLTSTNSLEFVTGNDNVTFRGAVGYMSSMGVVPNSELKRTTIDLRTTANLTPKLNVDVKVNYVKSSAANRAKVAQDPDNIFLNYLQMPRSISYSDLDPYQRADGKPVRWDYTTNGDGSVTAGNGGMILNPYWTVNKNTNDDNRDRLIGMANVQYKITPKLDVRIRDGMDLYYTNTFNRLGTGTPYWTNAGDAAQFNSGDLILQRQHVSQNTLEGFITYADNAVAKTKISLNVTLGASIFNYKTEATQENANGLYVADYYSMSVAKMLSGTNTKTEKEIQSLFGTVQLGYDSWVYLDVTGRNDWSSTLKKDNWSYFYPSIGAGWVISDMLKSMGTELPSFWTFAKVRGSYAHVGGDTDPYSINPTLTMVQFGGGITGATTPLVLPNDNLKPLDSRSAEIGADVRFFDNRIGLDFTYYKTNNKNQILNLDVPATTGYNQKQINAGNIQNKGVEITLNLTPVSLKNSLRWDMAINYAKNNNKVVALDPTTSVQFLSLATSQVQVIAREGSAFGDIMGTSFLRDSTSGKIVVDANGLPMSNTSSTKIGNFLPNWTGGISNTVSYKGLSLSFLIDVREGGQFYCGSIASAALAGTYKGTEAYREGGLIVDGVHADGTANATAVTSQSYWSRAASINESSMRDASFVRLKELSIGYNLPSSILKKSLIKSLKISLVGSNLWLISSHSEGIDPESSYTTSNSQGLELGSFPATRTYGFNINIGL
jgi:TonB-linked SusC/RagA family outer membrane protein